MKNLAKYFKLIGDANRLAILKAISEKERSVTEVINVTKLSQTLVSFHLRALREAEIVSPRREGPFIYYHIIHPELMEILGEFSRVFGMEDTLAVKTSKVSTIQKRKIRN